MNPKPIELPPEEQEYGAQVLLLPGKATHEAIRQAAEAVSAEYVLTEPVYEINIISRTPADAEKRAERVLAMLGLSEEAP